VAALEALVEDSDEGMLLADGQGHILYANAASERFLGYPPAELVGRLGFDLCRPEDLPAAREAFGRCLAQPGEGVGLTVDVVRRDGGFRTLAVTLVSRLPARGVAAVVVHFRDAAGPTEAERAEYRALFEHAPFGLGVADMEGNLLAFNNAIREPGGYTREDILQLGNVSRLYASAAERERVLGIAREQGFVRREEVRFRRKDGSSYDALLSLTPVQFEGRPCWCAAVEDISERKKADEKRRELEAQLRQAQKMEAVGRMTGGIAHDFNNILSVIMANAELIASALDAEAGEARGDLTELRAAAKRGAVMIRKLLGFARNADLNITPIDLGDLVTGLEGMLRHVIPPHIALEVHAAADTTALCDHGAVEQMILNLATNARDAMPAGGTVRIDVSPAVVERDTPARSPWLTPGAFIRLSVHDTGVGMDDRTRTRAFEPFFTTKPPGVGTGLGLSMVYGLVKQQRGFIDLVSEPGRGTTVHLYFPKSARESQQRRAASPAAKLPGGSATILVIEDDESLRRTGRRVLEHLGYRVLVARDGTEGLALFRARQAEIDLVISDMVMPGLTGAQVYEMIKRHHPEVRFLLSSGYQERPDRTLEVPAGVRVVTKPWTLEELAQTVREALDRPGNGE
jgi:PAS domain S-box-containing protein